MVIMRKVTSFFTQESLYIVPSLVWIVDVGRGSLFRFFGEDFSSGMSSCPDL